jgi:NAD(P)-dependent dehydrogenase (short-subunit alcohol dehydrogenase family)
MAQSHNRFIMELKGKAAIVTGASREIGAAIASRLVADGAQVLISHYGEAELAERNAEAIRKQGGVVEVMEADLTRIEASHTLVDRCVALYGRLDYFIANAGITIFSRMLETNEAQFDTVFDLNVKGSYFGARAASQQMIKQGEGGRIVFSSSVAGIRSPAGLSAYSITKAALRQMAKVVSAEVSPFGIRVNAVGIGAVVNERNVKIQPDYAEAWARINPLGRVVHPEDIAGAVRFLISKDADMITGQTLVVDGGFLTGARE